MKNLYVLITISIVIFYSITNAQWVKTNLPYSGTVNCLAIGTNEIGIENLFAGTEEGGGVFLSTDDGTNWRATNNGLLDSTIISSLVIKGPNIIAGSYGAIYYSTNSGASWQASDFNFPDNRVLCLAICDSNIFAGCISNSSGGILVSTNNGANWTTVFVAGRYTYVPSLISSGSNIFAGTSGLSSGVFQSSNNGTTWVLDDSTFVGGGGIRALAVSSTNLFAGTYFGVYLSTNNGLSWSPVNNGLPDYVNNYGWITTLAVSPNGAGSNNLFAGTDSAGVFLSIDNGSSWKAIGMTNYYINALTINDTYVFAATGEGVWRRPLTEILTGVEGQGIKIPNQFILEQNYPNPFNPSTIIQYAIASRQFVTLKVYDVLGNEVSTLVNEEKPVGNYEVNFNAGGLSSGIYFYKLQTGSFIETKKMMLLK